MCSVTRSKACACLRPTEGRTIIKTTTYWLVSRSDHFRAGCAASNAVCYPSLISVSSRSGRIDSARRTRGLFTGTARDQKVTCPPETRMLCQRVSCSPVETVTSTIFRGTTSCTVDHQPVRARCDSSRAAHLCKPEICGSNATNAVRRATWPLLSANPVRKTCHDAADATRISTATTMIAGNRRGPCCWAQPTVGSRSHYLCWRFRPRGIRSASLSVIVGIISKQISRDPNGKC